MDLILANKIAEIMAEHDPYGLVKIGSPSDEYMPEVRFLLTFDIPDDSNELAMLIQTIFETLFHTKSGGLVGAYRGGWTWPLKKFVDMSEDILQVMEEDNGKH